MQKRICIFPLSFEDGFYDSQLGDAIPLGMANAIKCSIVIFQSNEEIPVMYISPREHSSNVLFVVYTNCGPGHSDSVVYMREKLHLC